MKLIFIQKERDVHKYPVRQKITFTPLGIMIYVWGDIFGGKLYQQITLASNGYELETNSDCLEYVKVRCLFTAEEYDGLNI